MKIVTIVGARPQFIKAAPVSRALRRHASEFLVHTGQHYDERMSAVFFDELALPPPDVNLEVGSGPHGEQTGRMLAGIEQVVLAQRPDWVLVYGDTNSTLAGALAAAKLQVPVAHVEAGLRSFNRAMPEELNRVVADHLSELLFCPSAAAAENLAAEGIRRNVQVVGDVMADAFHAAAARARERSTILEALGVTDGSYVLATVHRAENTDDAARLASILRALQQLDLPVVFPVHPRTRAAMERTGLASEGRVRLTEPVGYLDMVRLERSARLVLTDSGGVQKEAYWSGVPCLTLRTETEWVETVAAGWNRVVGTDTSAIIDAARSFRTPEDRPPLYGDGQAAERIAAALLVRG